MKSLREKFEEEYAAVSVPADSGDGFKIKYVYYAPWYIWDLPEAVLAKKKRRIAGLSLGSFAVFLLASTRYSGVNGFVPVILCVAVALCAFVVELSGVFRFVIAKYRTSRSTYAAVNRILQIGPLFRALSLLAAVAFSLCFLFGNGVAAVDFVAICGYALCAAAAVLIYLAYRKIPVRTERNERMSSSETFL